VQFNLRAKAMVCRVGNLGRASRMVRYRGQASLPGQDAHGGMVTPIIDSECACMRY
jgi:hypothetical protein